MMNITKPLKKKLDTLAKTVDTNHAEVGICVPYQKMKFWSHDSMAVLKVGSGPIFKTKCKRGAFTNYFETKGPGPSWVVVRTQFENGSLFKIV
jgi:hypothetical protein